MAVAHRLAIGRVSLYSASFTAPAFGRAESGPSVPPDATAPGEPFCSRLPQNLHVGACLGKMDRTAPGGTHRRAIAARARHRLAAFLHDSVGRELSGQ